MIKLIGFQSQHGQFTSDTTGEVIDWSNRLLRCISDENIEEGEFGLKIVEQKQKDILTRVQKRHCQAMFQNHHRSLNDSAFQEYSQLTGHRKTCK